ncbi:MAG: glutamate synthase subunit alpha, partial [Gemmataceae bacterium]
MTPYTPPNKQGLYDPRYEHDACGVGFVVNLKNRQSHDIVRDALRILNNLEHRGACGCEKNTGDGAGILVQMPHAFLRQECGKLGIDLPAPGQYGAGLVFLPADERGRQICERAFERVVREEGQTVLGWRTVPVDPSPLGKTAHEAMPFIRQIFIGRNGERGASAPCWE